jgi:predicted nuclease of predicted toxin-antitoxin system
VLLRRAGHDAIHTLDLPAGSATPDRIINELSLQQQRVVITKDSDFYHSHLLQGSPWKLLLVRTGNIRSRDLKQLVERHLAQIVLALENNSLVELNRNEVRVIG